MGTGKFLSISIALTFIVVIVCNSRTRENILIRNDADDGYKERGDRNTVYPEEQQRFDWKNMIKPCLNSMKWRNKSSDHAERVNRTDAYRSALVHQDIKPVGFYSKVVLQSKTSDGRLKRYGGDSWQVYLNGTAAYSNGFVRDMMDGTYEFTFAVPKPGNYTLNLVLEYSLCDGFKDPPDGWFESGDAHGEFQHNGTLGYLDDFLVQRIAPLKFTVKVHGDDNDNYDYDSKHAGFSLKAIGEKACFEEGSSGVVHDFCFKSDDFERNCKIVSHSYGAWSNDNNRQEWTPNVPFILDINAYRGDGKGGGEKEKLETLWFYGDSITYRLWDSAYTRALCRQVFKNCMNTYTWIYPLASDPDKYVSIYEGKKFNYTKFFDPIREMFEQASMKTNRSVVLINFGLHITMTIQFDEYKRVLDYFIRMIKTLKERRQATRLPHIIWKTTTMSHKENARIWNLTHTRFLTNQRINLYNAYTNTRLCSEGITICDAYPITASYPKGPIDHVHYDYNVLEPLEDALAEFILRRYK
eukprot:gene16170-17793_t